MAKQLYKYVTKSNPYGFHEIEVDLLRVRQASVNPRKISDRNKLQLKKSLDKFGLLDKPILNLISKDKNYDYELIAGHQRTSILIEEGVTKCLCLVPEIMLTPKESEELLIRHNKNTGEFDIEKLVLFNSDDLIDYGFLHKELQNPAGNVEDEESVPDPIFPLAPRMSEKHSYVMIYVDNEIEKAFLENFFKLEKEQDYKSSKVGTGRVVPFKKFKEIIDERAS